MADNCGQTTIIPDNNQVSLQNVNQTITVTDNNCCTTVDVAQPITQVIQVLTGPIGATGASGTLPTSGSLNLSGSINVSGSVSANNFIGGIFSGSFTGSLQGTASYADTASYALNSNLLDGKDSTIFATTGSNTFVGNQTISGSVNIIIPQGYAYGINENPTPNNIFYSYPSQDTNTSNVQVGWIATVPGVGIYTVSNVQYDTPYPPFISITLSDPSLALDYRVGVTFTRASKTWNFNNDGTTSIPGDLLISGSVDYGYGISGNIKFISGSAITSNGPNIDVTAGPDGWVELGSNSQQNFVWVDNQGIYLIANWDGGIDTSAWRIATGSRTLTAAGDLNMNGFNITGSLFGTASYALTASYVLNSGLTYAIVTGSITASVDVGDTIFLIKSSSYTPFSVGKTGEVTISGSASSLLSIKNTNNTNVLAVSQSGVIVLATSSIELSGTAPNGGIYFTSSSLFIGVD